MANVFASVSAYVSVSVAAIRIWRAEACLKQQAAAAETHRLVNCANSCHHLWQPHVSRSVAHCHAVPLPPPHPHPPACSLSRLARSGILR